MKLPLLCIVVLLSIPCFAQHDTFPYARITYAELDTKYPQDTSASIVIIQEFGRAEIDNENDHNLLFTYHVKLKVLKKEGLDEANIEIELRKNRSATEVLKNVRASSFNIENNSIQETKVLTRNVFTTTHEDYDLKKFTIPNVRVGTVIEYEYQLESPFFVLNFRPWSFQGEFPKLSSEYWATIPANYRYNAALTGVLELKQNENEVLKDYFTPGGGRVADCIRYKWSMKNVPAFIEEDYMTSPRNFLAAINFELIQIEYFDGRKDRVTKEWADVDQELRTYDKFGVQLKRGKEVAEEHLSVIMAGQPDSLLRAQEIFEFVRKWYHWNENFGFYSEAGIKKAFEEATGNVGDLNLTLVAALRFAGYRVDPMILSTRRHGTPTDLFPVLSEFNYVVAKLDLGGKTYLLDATDDFLPFGVVPERCLNGKGRVIPVKAASYWFDIKPADRFRRMSSLTLKLSADGKLTGTVSNTYAGYKAAEVREGIKENKTPEDYLKEKFKEFQGEITDISYLNLENFSKPLVEKFTIRLDFIDPANANSFLINPFIMGHLSRNPFRSAQRIYPVDYGAPIDATDIINIELPADFETDELPEKVGLGLPNNGGRFICTVKKEGRILTISSALAISKTLFSPDEYHYLKEMYTQAIKSYSMDIVLKKKTGQ
jgi:hypothetical protein